MRDSSEIEKNKINNQNQQKETYVKGHVKEFWEFGEKNSCVFKLWGKEKAVKTQEHACIHCKVKVSFKCGRLLHSATFYFCPLIGIG